jgi:hypothetical protein
VTAHNWDILVSSLTLRGNERGKILINTSVSLLILYVVFVIAGLVTSVEPLCGLVSALFQYIILVFFSWTAAEAVFLYLKLVVVLGSQTKKYALKAALIAWLLPLLVTVVSAGPGHEYYINPYYCRATEWPFWLGLILPFSIINVFNWIMFAVIITKLLFRKTVDVDSKAESRRALKQNFFIAVGLSLLLGLGWGFGLTATSSDIKELTFSFQVVFSLFVGSQGVLIFIFHGLRSRHFRQVWTSAFGLRKKRKVPEYYSKKHAGSGAESNMTATGVLSSFSSKQSWATENQSVELSQVCGTDESGLTLAEESSTTVMVKEEKECLQQQQIN